MIYKYWNVEMFETTQITKNDGSWVDRNGIQVDADRLRMLTESSEATIARAWTVLSSYEEQVANTSSDILLPVSNGDRSGVVRLCLFLSAIGVLFDALDAVRERRSRAGLSGQFTSETSVPVLTASQISLFREKQNCCVRIS